MLDEQDFQEEPLDFSEPQHLYSCPYCSEIISPDELDNFLCRQNNTFVCPNCRKKLNIHELGSEI